MFEVGDRVVCVDVRPTRAFGFAGEVLFEKATNLVRGKTYTILALIPPGSPTEDGFVRTDLHVAVGVLNFRGADSHNADRFRKLRDISQSLRELKELVINCPALAEPVSP